MRRRPLILLALALALAFAAPAAGDDTEDEKAAVDARIAALQAEIAAAKTQEGVLTSQLSSVVSELEAAQSAVDRAQGALESLEAELATEQAQLDRLTTRLRVQTLRLKQLQAEYREAVGALEARVRAIYIEGVPDVLSFLVNAESFDDLIDNYEFMERIGAQDKRIARQVERVKTKAAAERRATADTRRLTAASVSVIAARTEEAQGVRDELASSRDTLLAARRLKASALTATREDRAEYLAEVEALAAQSAALAAAIRDAQNGSTGSGKPSAAGFVWPVSGPVDAAAAGTVIHAGWLGGYGNLVVLDHGDGLATAYAHASAILVAVGQSVSQGETVSLVGSTGHSTGPHLHFEVRVNGVAVDPLLYL